VLALFEPASHPVAACQSSLDWAPDIACLSHACIQLLRRRPSIPLQTSPHKRHPCFRSILCISLRRPHPRIHHPIPPRSLSAETSVPHRLSLRIRLRLPNPAPNPNETQSKSPRIVFAPYFVYISYCTISAFPDLRGRPMILSIGFSCA
jgi:hypothetical protein